MSSLPARSNFSLQTKFATDKPSSTMLMPSAFSCGTSHSRPQSALFASSPASALPTSAIGSIFSTCRSLQSLLATPFEAREPFLHSLSLGYQMPTPPLSHAEHPIELRLRPRLNKNMPDALQTQPRKRIVQRASMREAKKRRRAEENEVGGSDDASDSDELNITDDTSPHLCPQTPKRARIAPEILPLGLERGDYHGLLLDEPNQMGTEDSEVVVKADGEDWSIEDDRILVELVLEKLKLTKSDWQECARSLGRDRSSVGRRWKRLMVYGEIGLRRSSRRVKIHGTWRSCSS